MNLSVYARKIAVIAGLIFVGAPSQAHKRDFAFTYDWWTPRAGEREVETTHTYDTAGRTLEGALEYETGLTDRWSLAGYYLYAKENHEKARTMGYQVESRYRFGEFEFNRVLPAVYAEYANSKDEPAHGEAKLILSRFSDDSAETAVSLNLIGERRLQSGGESGSGYALGASRRASDVLRVGVEAVGGFDDGSLALGPSLAWDVAPGARVILASVSSVRHGSGTAIRLLTEYEW